MADIMQFDPLSDEAVSTPIAGLSEAVTKISNILNMNSSENSNITLIEVFISATDRYRIYQVPNGKRLWLGNPNPIIRKNGSVINSVSDGFEIDYIGGAIKFEPNYRLTQNDVITADFTSLNADSKTLNDIKTSITNIQVIVNKNKGYFADALSLRTAFPTANAGDYAIVGGTTDTFWIWDTDSNDWKDTFKSTDLANYYTKSEADNLLNSKQPNIVTHGDTIASDDFYYGGRKTWISLFEKVRSTILTGIVFTNNSDVVATDSLLTAIGKLQAQINGISLTTDNITQTDGQVTKTQREINTEFNSAIGQLSNPNLLINGDFQVWQRGTALDFTYGAYKYTTDRWICSTNFSNVKVEKDGEFAKLTAVTVGSGSDFVLVQGFETVNVVPLRGKKVTFSVNLKKYVSMTTGDIVLNVYTGTGIDEVSAATGRIITTKKISYSELSTEPKLFTVTADIPTNTNSLCVTIRVGTLFGINQINNGGSFGVKYTKLELGEIATPLSPRPYGEELALCQRYYRKITGTIFPSYITNDKRFIIFDFSSLVQNMRESRTFLNLAAHTTFNIYNIYGFNTTSWGGVYNVIQDQNGIVASKNVDMATPIEAVGAMYSFAIDADVY